MGQDGRSPPGNRAVVHHVIAFVRPPGSNWMKDAQPGVPFIPKRQQRRRRARRPAGRLCTRSRPGDYEPGQARLIKAGSDIILQIHYTANGKEATDRTRIGLVFATEPPKERIYTLVASTNKFAIPAGDPNYRVDSKFEFGHDARIVSFLPHMHLRGKDYEYRVAVS